MVQVRSLPNGRTREGDNSMSPDQPPPTPSESTTLWPNNRRVEVIGLTGDFGSGKTIFGISICPGPRTLVYDFEKSSSAYESLGFHRVDMADEMIRISPKGYKPIDLFRWWYDHVRSIKPGQYSVIMVDPISEIEAGIVEYISERPQEFGLTPNQIRNSAGLMWGKMKDFWKSILQDIAARCETFVFTSHLRSVWRGNAPTGKKSAKGKETLMELASLYLWLDRKADEKGNVPDVPAANVLKSRIADHRFVDGELRWIDLLPPRLPKATPKAIRDYILSPPDYAKLKPGERFVEEKATEEELAAMRLATAEAERDAELARVERIKRIDAAGQQSAAGDGQPDSETTPAPSGLATVEQLRLIKSLKEQLGISKETWETKILRKRGVDSAKQLTTEQANELVETLEKKVMIQAHQRAYESIGIPQPGEEESPN